MTRPTLPPPTPFAVCLAGPTACGKSALAMALAQQLPLEIISVDSALVYRGMDIGTAKPSAADRAAVPHHLIDIIDPIESYSAARFAADALRLVGEIQARGKLPLLVGGTMLYFKALRGGLHPMPEADAGIRAAIDRRAAAHGWPALHAELARVDPATAARLAPADAQRIQRALEVFEISGKPLSGWHAPRDAAPLPAAAHWPMVSLEPTSRAWLHERIAARFQAMLDAGFLAEVRALRSRGDLDPGLPAMRCVGYRQAWQWFEAGLGQGSEQGSEQGSQAGRSGAFEAEAIAATRQLAKRQLTWLRSISSRQVVACDASDSLREALAALRACAPAQRAQAQIG